MTVVRFLFITSASSGMVVDQLQELINNLRIKYLAALVSQVLDDISLLPGLAIWPIREQRVININYGEYSG